jgi:hypothetical protein
MSSGAGGPHFYGKQGIDFVTQCKTVTSKWSVPTGDDGGPSDHHHACSQSC